MGRCVRKVTFGGPVHTGKVLHCVLRDRSVLLRPSRAKRHAQRLHSCHILCEQRLTMYPISELSQKRLPTLHERTHCLFPIHEFIHCKKLYIFLRLQILNKYTQHTALTLIHGFNFWFTLASWTKCRRNVHRFEVTDKSLKVSRKKAENEKATQTHKNRKAPHGLNADSNAAKSTENTVCWQTSIIVAHTTLGLVLTRQTLRKQGNSAQQFPPWNWLCGMAAPQQPPSCHMSFLTRQTIVWKCCSAPDLNDFSTHLNPSSCRWDSCALFTKTANIWCLSTEVATRIDKGCSYKRHKLRLKRPFGFSETTNTWRKAPHFPRHKTGKSCKCSIKPRQTRNLGWQSK